MIEGNLTQVNIRFNNNNSNEKQVEISMPTKSFGKVNAKAIIYRGKEILLQIKSDTSDGINKLQKNERKIKERVKDLGYDTVVITYKSSKNEIQNKEFIKGTVLKERYNISI